MRKCRLLCVLLTLSLFLTGCWNRREIGNLSIVMGFAVDSADEDKIEVTSQIANTKNSTASGEGSGGDASHYNNVTIEGEYVFPSIRTSVSKAGSKLYLAHNFVIIFGQEAAEKGLGNYMDFFLRDHEMRLSMHLLVARGKGKDILDTSADFQKIPAIHIKNLIESQQELSAGMTVDLLDFTSRLYTKKAAPLIPIIEIDETGGEKQLRMSGTAVFKEDKMIGELSAHETRGILWAKGEVEKGVVMTSPSEKNHTGIDILQASGGIKPEIDENGNVSMVIQVRADGAFGSERGHENYTSEDGLDILLSSFSAEIENEIRSALRRGRELESDLFGFSEILYKKDPKLWEEKKDMAFHNLPVRIETHVKILSAGRMNQPVN